MTTAIFFDWDGTLVDSLGLLANAHNYVREQLGYPLWSKPEYFAAMTRSTRELYPMLYGDRSAEAQDMLYDFIKTKHMAYLKIMPGAKEILDMLREMKIPMAVISNKRNDVLVTEVEALGWQDYFGVYIGAGVAVKDKPSAAPLLHALAHHPDKPKLSDLLYVGDTETDLKTCSEAGCACAYVQHDGQRPDMLDLYNPVIAVNNMAELKIKLIAYLQS